MAVTLPCHVGARNVSPPWYLYQGGCGYDRRMTELESSDFSIMGMPYQATRPQAREVQHRMSEHPAYGRHFQLIKLLECLSIDSDSDLFSRAQEITKELAGLDIQLMRATKGIIESVLAEIPEGL